MPEDLNSLLRSTGCTHIQEAIKLADKMRVPLKNLDDDVIDTLVATMASAASVGAQASPQSTDKLKDDY